MARVRVLMVADTKTKPALFGCAVRVLLELVLETHNHRPRSPAQASKLTDHAWTVQELIDPVSKRELCTI